MAVQRHFLRSFVRRAGAWAIFLLIIMAAIAFGLFGLLEPLDEVWPQLEPHPKTQAGLMIFAFVVGFSMTMVLAGAIGTLRQLPKITRPRSDKRALRSPMMWLAGIHVGAAINLCALLFPLGGSLEKNSEGGEAFRLMTPHETPTTTIQFLLFVAAIGSALTTIAARRAMAELDLATRGEDERVRPMAFEVMLSSPATERTPPLPSVSGDDVYPVASAAPPVAMPKRPAAAVHTHSVLDEEVGRRRQWEWLLMVLVLAIIPLTVPHVGILYDARQAAYKTDFWKEIYENFHRVPLNYQGGSQYGNRSPTYLLGRSRLTAPATAESVSCGVCAVITVGSVLAMAAIHLLAVIWAVVCIIAGPRWRGFALTLAWVAIGVVAVSWVAETYLCQQFRHSPEAVAVLFTSISQSSSISSVTGWFSFPSPLDLSMAHLVIPLAILALLTRAGMRDVFGRRRRR